MTVTRIGTRVGNKVPRIGEHHYRWYLRKFPGAPIGTHVPGLSQAKAECCICGQKWDSSDSRQLLRELHDLGWTIVSDSYYRGPGVWRWLCAHCVSDWWRT